MERIKDILNRVYSQYKLVRTRQRWIKEGAEYLEKISLPPLTKEEILEVRKHWKGINLSEKLIEEHRLYKKIHGFDPRYLTMPIYDPLIIRKLNPFQDASVFVNKGLFDILFSDLKQPKYYIKKIRDNYFNSNAELISESDAVEILLEQNSFVIKPSINSHGGDGIKLIRNKLRHDEIKSLLSGYKSDLIVQEIVEQHIDTAKFNPNSLNTIRILTLLINGEVTILKSALRCGQNGAEVDNATSGGLMIKIRKDGTLEDFGIDSRFEKIYAASNGVKIADNRISDYYKLEKIVKEGHPKYYPSLHIIAWDFAIDINGHPIFIEGNTKVPGIFWIQMCGGPIFGDLTDKVIKYILNNERT